MPASPFRALASRNYRLWFAGQTVSLLGTWMTQTATLWLTYQLTSSSFAVGVLAFCTQAPSFLLGPLAGAWADRVDGRRLLMITQALSMLQSFALAGFAFAGLIDTAHLLVLGAFQGVVSAFEMPVRQSLIVTFVEDRAHLGNAIALNSTMFNLARLAGPALAGFVIAAWGPAVCYGIDGLSFVAVLVCLTMMRLTPREEKKVAERASVWAGVAEGFSYVWNHPLIRTLLVLVTAVSFFGFSYSVLVPEFARDVFKGDSKTLGYLMSGTGIGALMAAFYLSTRSSAQGLGRVIVTGGVLLGFGVIAFSQMRSLWTALPCMTAIGLGGVLLMAGSNTMVQTLVDDSKRGRVMALFVMTFTGTTPLSALAAGSLARRVGTTWTLLASGLIVLLTVGIFHRARPRLRAAMAARRAAEAEAKAAAETTMVVEETARPGAA